MNWREIVLAICSRSEPLPNMNIEGRLWGHTVTASMTSSPWKIPFWYNLGQSLHIRGQNEAVFHISNFSKWPPFWGRDKFLPDVILEVEYISKIAMCISDILSFWSTLWLNYWRRYINFNIWSTLWTVDVIDDVTSTWNITCTNRHIQLYTSKILFVWHQSFIATLSGRTPWNT